MVQPTTLCRLAKQCSQIKSGLYSRRTRAYLLHATRALSWRRGSTSAFWMLMIPGIRIICKISKPSCRNIPKVISLLRPTVLSTPMAAARNRADCRRRMAVCLATGEHWARAMTLSGPPPQRCGARHCWRRVSSGWVKKSGKIWIFGRDWREITRVLPMPPVFAWIITVGQKPTPEHG